MWVKRIKGWGRAWKNQYLWAWRETERGCQDAEKKEAGEGGKGPVRKGERGGLVEADRVGKQRSKTGKRSVNLSGRPLSAAFEDGVSWAAETSQKQVSQVPEGYLNGKKTE